MLAHESYRQCAWIALSLSLSLSLSVWDSLGLHVDFARQHNACGAGAILRMAVEGALSDQGLCQLLPRSLTLTQRTSVSYCQLSINTILSLGVLADKRNAEATSPPWSLYTTMEPFLRTKQGRRLLRASLLQPLTNVPTIEERYNAIGELQGSAEVQDAVQNFLAHAPQDVHRCLPAPANGSAKSGSDRLSMSASTAFIQAVLRLRNMLGAVQVLCS